MRAEEKEREIRNFYLLAKGGSRRCFVTVYLLPVSLFSWRQCFGMRQHSTTISSKRNYSLAWIWGGKVATGWIYRPGEIEESPLAAPFPWDNMGSLSSVPCNSPPGRKANDTESHRDWNWDRKGASPKTALAAERQSSSLCLHYIGEQ